MLVIKRIKHAYMRASILSFVFLRLIEKIREEIRGNQALCMWDPLDMLTIVSDKLRLNNNFNQTPVLRNDILRTDSGIRVFIFVALFVDKGPLRSIAIEDAV